MDLYQLTNWDTVYIYKNTTTEEFEILTWSLNEEYKYIDIMWNKVIPADNIWKTYIREFIKDIDILKHTVKPSEIENLVFHFDATSIDALNNSTLTSDTWAVETWKDLSWNNNDAFNLTTTYQPIYVLNWINWSPYVKFDWIDDILKIDDNTLINTATDYSKKSITIIFKTWFDVQSTQNIYEQWGSTNWYAIQIDWWRIYAWVWNTSWDVWHEYKKVDLWIAIPDSNYFVMLIQNSSYWTDSENNLQAYLNWELISTLDHADIQNTHSDDSGIWGVNNLTLKLSNNTSLSSLSTLNEWWIWELISWNHALSKDEINWILQYFTQKWLNLNQSVYYNTVITNVRKLND